MSEQKHTALPWSVSCDSDGYTIASEDASICVLDFYEGAEEDAEFIVCACNAHYDLLEACKGLLRAFSGHSGGVIDKARAAIVKAEGVVHNERE